MTKFLLAGEKFIRETHLGQRGFTNSACGPFTENTERIEKIKETGDSRQIYQNELDKVCSQHDIIDGDFKDLTRRIVSDKTLRDKAFNIAKNLKYYGFQCEFASMVYKLLIEPLCLQVNLQLKIKICQTKSQLKNCTSQLIVNLTKEK